MTRQGGKAELYLNGKCVGGVSHRGSNASWSYGEFEPLEEFAPFATVFGRWSLLMHAYDETLSDAAADELRRTENEIDALEAKIFWVDESRWTSLRQVNIDGILIEWKND